jgi:CheY-like chemotaxis protein
VVVLDLESPQLDGIRCIQRLKTTDATKHVRIVVYTTKEEIKERALQAGAAAFVSKPNADKVRETLETFMGL